MGKDYSNTANSLIAKASSKEIVRYIISSLISGLTEIGTFFIMSTILSMNYIIAAVVSFLIATIVGYIAKRKIAFNNKYRPRRKQFGVFAIITIGGIIINTSAVILLVEMTQTIPLIAKIIGILIAFVYNYLLSKYFIFKLMA